jgi:hypothetical protein
MAFNRLMLTTPGKTLYAKAQQGKTLHFSHVAIGDGSIGTGSLVNRTALISEKMSLAIDAVQIVNSTESAIVTSLSNSALAEGFYFREIGIYATDPDTSAEVLYLYDNAGTDGEFIPASSSGVTVSERLKFLLLLDNVTSVTFTASGNPIYLSTDDIQDGTVGSSVLWSSTYIASQLKTNADAIVTKQDKTNSLTEETNLDSTDFVAGYDTSAGAHRKYSLGAIGIWLKSVFDLAYATIGHTHATLYAALSHTQTASTITDFAATVRSTVLTGISTATDAAISATDTALAALGKLQAQVTAHRTNTNNPHGTTVTQVAAAGGTLPIANGGTGATTGDGARTNIGAAKRFNKTATLAVANWTGSAAPYTYELSDADIFAADTPHVDRVTGTDTAAGALINTAWGLIAGYTVKPQTSAGKITFYASAKPAVAIPIMYEVVR